MFCPSLRCCLGVASLIAVAGLVAVATITTPPPTVQARGVRLADSADSPLGDGTALVIGGSGIPIPAERNVEAADNLYLAPRGLTGTLSSPLVDIINDLTSLTTSPSVFDATEFLDQLQSGHLLAMSRWSRSHFSWV